MDLREGVGGGDLLVGVDDKAAELTEEAGDVGLAGADAADDADDGLVGEHGGYLILDS